MSEGAKPVRRVAIVANPNVSEGYSERLMAMLDERGVEIEQFTEPTGVREDGDLDLVFVLGGDGTMLRASRMYPGRVLLGVNLGTLGFMSGMRPEELESGVEKVLKGGIHVQEYRMLEVRLEGEEEARTAVNDAVLVKKHPHHIT